MASSLQTQPSDGAALVPRAGELDHAMRVLSQISGDLLAGYAALERRAQHVEDELCLANAELTRKIAALDAMSSHLEAILGALPTGVVVRDFEGRVVRANPSACAILGVREEELLGLRSHPGLSGEHASGAPRELRCPDGLTRVVSSRWSPILAERDRATGSVEILDDRTEVTALSERLHSLDKLAALGHMAGGIAHEVRNPLTAVQGFAALLARELERGSREHRWASLIVAGAGEADAILSSMLSLASPEGLSLETIDARELVESAIAAAQSPQTPSERGGSEPAHQISWNVSAPSFAGDRIKLRQALRNLIANALEAQPAGGQVEITLALERGQIVMRVTDAGSGVPAELRRRIFDPFFTTRAQGTGLGLALVSTIAGLHGGAVELSPAPGPLGGADFRLSIPFHAPG